MQIGVPANPETDIFGKKSKQKVELAERFFIWHTGFRKPNRSPRSGNHIGFPHRLPAGQSEIHRKELIPMIDNPNEVGLEETKPSSETEQGEKGESPLILGKFKDYSELEKAYRESERFISQTREELKEAREHLKEAAIPDEITQFQADLDAFLDANALTHRAYEFISYLTENPELLSLDSPSAFAFVKRALTTPPAPYREYMESLSQTPPAMIAGQGGELYTTPGAQPKTFEEAGDLFLQMVKN